MKICMVEVQRYMLMFIVFYFSFLNLKKKPPLDICGHFGKYNIFKYIQTHELCLQTLVLHTQGTLLRNT